MAIRRKNKKDQRNKRRLLTGAGLVGGAALAGGGIYALKRKSPSAPTQTARPNPPAESPKPQPKVNSTPQNTSPKPRPTPTLKSKPTPKPAAKPTAPRKPLLLAPAKNRADAFPDRVARARARTPEVPASAKPIPVKRSIRDTPETLPNSFERGRRSKTSGKTRSQKTQRVAYEAATYRRGQGFLRGSKQQGPKTKAQTQYEKISKRANDYRESNKRLGDAGFEGRNSRTYKKTKAQKSKIVQQRREKLYKSGFIRGERTNLKRNTWDPKDLVPQGTSRRSNYEAAVDRMRRAPNAIRDRYLQKGIPQKYSKLLKDRIISFHRY
jgi:hypothetical protein